MRPFGVSFIVRVHNEDATIGAALRSLANVLIPHEIVVILHRCTDATAAITRLRAREQPSIMTVATDRLVSRAGVENLATPRGSLRSLASYYNWCFSHARYRWQFKFDADFIASDGLVRFLNEDLAAVDQTGRPTRISLPCQWEDISNDEPYLFNCLQGYGKAVFWETPLFPRDADVVFRKDAIITHDSSLQTVKLYWKALPWFFDMKLHNLSELDAREADAIRRNHQWLVDRFGVEPRGLARASNPACDEYYRRIHEARTEIEAQGIHLYD